MTSQDTVPEKKHRPAWMRAADILLRTMHIAVAGLLMSGFVFQIPFSELHAWHSLTILSGLGLLFLEFAHSRNWPHQVRGIMGMIHMGLPGIVHLWPSLAVPLATISLAFGSIGSHLPKKIRHWSLLYRKEVD